MKSPSPSLNEVWITGWGAVSALGSGVAAHAGAMAESRSGLASHRFFDGRVPDPVVCGRVSGEALAAGPENGHANRADRILETAFDQAFSSAGLEPGCAGEILIGSTLGTLYGGETYSHGIPVGVSGNIRLMDGFLAGSPAKRVAAKHRLPGRCFTVCSACASGTTAVGRGYRLVRSGEHDRVFAGGVDALSPFIIAGFHSLRLLSAEPCRPFDRSRSGLNPGEGSAVLVLESKDAARARGARPLARVTGFGEALEAYHATRAHPEGCGISRAVEKALRTAAPRDLPFDHAHLHGTATAWNDLSEYRGLERVLGDKLSRVPVFSTKSMTGHTFGGAGAIASVFAILSLREGRIPPTLFHRIKDPLFSKLDVSESPVEAPNLERVLVTTLGFGGESAAVLFERAPDEPGECPS